MGPDEALHRTHSYFVIVIIVAIVTSLVPLIFFPFGMNLIEALLFMAVFQGTFRTRLDAHESYSGYGVGWVVNSTLRLNIIGNAGGQVLGGLFVRNIIKCWFTLVVLSMVVIVVGTLFAWVMSIDFPRVLAVPIVAILLACFCEGC